ncbi:Alpha/Beta hydrolase protein [Aspergillus pseudoustus]|uniref:Alpha/Beta hydrolase protein n=1 Tax=Aspergillus pseudoustus TaxID=1810923 RepID=A0ABR4IIU0_9EURO
MAASDSVPDISITDHTSFPYTFTLNATVPLPSSAPGSLVRCNIYRPQTSEKVPAILTYGPYGKDLPYEVFHPASWGEINPEHRSAHSAWETPDPGYWTKHGYAVVRADERGLGQSPGLLNTMSRGTSEAFFDVVEWVADQEWCSGKVGLLGISYYAGSQWRVAARRPKGLAAIIPWEGMADYYRDRCRHGGILSNVFIDFWWRRVESNQYGRSEGLDGETPPIPPEKVLSAEELAQNRREQPVDNRIYRFRDDEYYASKEYTLSDIQVPLLSVGNWGGITLHLRGNIEGYTHAGSEFKYLRMITGRHDLPFYYAEEAEVQRSFLDAFLKGEDRDGWSIKGKVPPVSLVVRKGDVGFNDAQAERAFLRRDENEWPIARTQYRKLYLTPQQGLTWDEAAITQSLLPQKLSYKALGTLKSPQLLQFTTAPFEKETEITGHITAHLNVSVSANPTGTTPSDIDLFVTLRHLLPNNKEVFYTGSAGDPVPLCKGWLRVSLRKVDALSIKNRPHLPARDYFSTDVQPVIPGEVYPVDVEIWPTNVVVEKGSKIMFELSSGDTQGSGIFRHEDEVDRAAAKFDGYNHVHFAPGIFNYVTLPIIPPK